MNANNIIDESMSLEEKLKAIEKAMYDAQQTAAKKAEQAGIPFVPVDPSTLTMCEGCQ